MNKTHLFLVILEIGQVQDEGVGRSSVKRRHNFWFREGSLSVCLHVVQRLMDLPWATFTGTLILDDRQALVT